jgi:outer membrane protein TolC
MKTMLIILFLILNAFNIVNAQPMLTVEDAVSMALKNNYDILVAHNDAEAAKVNNAAGNAGMLPTVAIIGSDNYSINTIDQKLPGGAPDIQSPDATTNAFNAGAALNWTLFDGGKMFVTKRKLGEIQTLGEIQFKDKVLQTVYNVIAAYYDVVRQKQILASLEEAITYNMDRVNIGRTSFNAGLSPKTIFLQAQIDLNVFKENAINQRTVISVAKRTLNQLLSRDAEVVLDVYDSIPYTFSPDTGRLREKLLTHNTSVISLQKQVDIARLGLEEFYSLRYPKISLNAGYDFFRTDISTGSILMNRGYGPQIGASVSIPIYQAGAISRQIALGKLTLQSAQYDLESGKQLVYTQVQNALDEFENQRQLLAIEKDNTALAKENLDISMARLRYGQSTSLELRQAEESYEDARTRLINIEYNVKIAETKLKQLLADL